MLTDLRLAIRAQRTELIVLGVGGLVFVAAFLGAGALVVKRRRPY
jgi:hypothetical protein